MFGASKSDTIKFEVGNLLDFNFCLRKQHEDQVRPKSRYLFISSIMVSVKYTKDNRVELDSEISVVPVLSQPTFKRDPICLEAIQRIKHQFGCNSFEKSNQSALAILNYDETNLLTIQNLVADWKRIWIAEVMADDKLSRTMNNQEGGKGKKSGYLVMKYGFDYKNLDQLYAVLIDEQNSQITIDAIEYEGPRNLVVPKQIENDKKVEKLSKRTANPSGH